MAYHVTQGTVFARGNGASPEVYTAVGQVTSISDLGQSRSLIDVTTLDSTSREYEVAIKDGQEMQLTLQYDADNTGMTGLRDDMDAGTRRSFQITFYDTGSPAPTATFTALVTQWVTNIDIDSVVILNVTLKPTGDITWANG